MGEVLCTRNFRIPLFLMYELFLRLAEMPLRFIRIPKKLSIKVVKQHATNGWQIVLVKCFWLK